MGHKKKNIGPPRSKQQSQFQSCETEAHSSICIPNPKMDPECDASSSSSAYSNIKLECERALTSLRRGNHTKALRLMKELCSRHHNSSHAALIHRVQGTVCFEVASIIDDPKAKQRHLKNGIESAKRAVELSPNSIEFARFYANLLYKGKEYEQVVQECERALSIDNPVDPAKDSLQEESQQKISNTEARISHVQAELRDLIRNSKQVSLFALFKNLGNGEERLEFRPIRQVPEDTMEVRSVQTTRRG